jgi:hypothetical protein
MTGFGTNGVEFYGSIITVRYSEQLNIQRNKRCKKSV